MLFRRFALFAFNVIFLPLRLLLYVATIVIHRVSSRSIPVFGYVLKVLWSRHVLTQLMDPSDVFCQHRWNCKLCYLSGFKYPLQQQALRTISDPDHQQSQRTILQYALRHAIAVYPPWFLSALFVTPSWWDAFKSTQVLIEQWFGFTGQDWMVKCDSSISSDIQRDNKLYTPPFYLVRDDKQKTFVLSIRGSSTSSDWITDCAAWATPLTIDSVEGMAHYGILRSARTIYEEVIYILRAIYATEKSDYDLVVVGHSLGGGTASLLALCFIENETEMKKNKNILEKLKVYAFATPSVVSKNIASMALVQKYVTSIILNTDVVSRIGVESLNQYYRRVQYIREYGQEVIKEQDLVRFLAARPAEEETPYAARKQLLVPNGNVLWFLPKNNKNKGGFSVTHLLQIIWNCVKGDNDEYDAHQWNLCDGAEHRSIYNELLFDGWEGIYAHFPFRYAWALGIKEIFPATGTLQ